MRTISLVLIAAVACMAANDKKIVCYWGSWSIYRPGAGAFNTTHIDPTLCTHLIYAFAGLNESSEIKILDPWADLADGGGKNGYNLFNALRNQNKNLATLAGVGGWNQGSANYSKMASSAESRKTFVESAVKFVKNYNFSGLDMDWEYPAQRDGAPDDKENFVLLLKELKERFSQEGLILSAAVAAAESSASKSYNISGISEYLDFINLMTYDFHVPADNKTGFNAPLYAGFFEKGKDRKLNIHAAVNYWLRQGAPKEKLILGMPFYGRTYTLVDPKKNGIGAATSGPGTAGPYTQEAGTLGFNEICDTQKKENLRIRYSFKQQVPYIVTKNQWISYDNVLSIREKAHFVKSVGLGGAMVWSIETDDFTGNCYQAKNPLLRSINAVLRDF